MKKLYQIKSKVIIISIAILLIALSAVLCIFKVQATKTAKSNTNLNAVAEGVNIQSDIYRVEEGYISRILPETTLRDLKNNLDKEDITVTKKDGNLLKETEFIGTGMKLTYGQKEYKLAVVDDLNGDGKAGITDLTQMKLISVGLRAKPVNEYAKAGDINGDGKVSITDLTKSNLASVNLIDIIAPTSFTPEVVSTKDTITVQGETSDSNSGIKEYWFEINNNGWVQNTDKLNTKYTFTGLNMETKYTIRMKAVDKAGNVRTTKRIEIETLNEENANISIVASTTEWTNQNILVAINFNSNVAKEKKQISLDNGNTWVDYTAPITVEKNMTIKARVVNTSGVVLEEQEKQITNIDKLAPKDFKASVTTTDNSMTVSALNAVDADATSEYAKSEIKEYQYEIIQGNMKWAETSENSTFTFNGLKKGDKYRVKVKAIDNAGNEKYAIKLVLEDGTEGDPDTTEIIVRDNTAKYTLTYNANGGTVTPTSVEAKAGEEITLPTPTKQFTVRYSVGNETEVVPDSVTITYTFDGWYASLEGGEAVNYTTMPSEDTEIFAHWTCENPSITLPTPEKEGYEFDGWYTDEELTDKIPDGPYTPTEDVTLHPKWEPTIDKKIELAGGITITANPTMENYTNQNVTVTVTYPEIEELEKQISVDNGYNWKTYTGVETIEGNTTVKVRMKDSKGQTSTVQSLLIDKIDKLVPLDFDVTVETTTNTIKLTASTADAEAENGSAKSGIAGYKFKINEEEWSALIESGEHTFTGLTEGQTYKVVVKAIDNAGNETIARNCKNGENEGLDIIPTQIPDYYGKEVTGYTAGGVSDWRIFHKDEDGRIYLIADDYITREQIPASTGGHNISNGASQFLNSANFNEDVLNDYTGSEWIKDETNVNPNAKKWLDIYLNSSYGTNNTNKNMKAVAYMMDTNIWSRFVDSTYAEYAIGGPTIELFCESYKVTHPNRYIVCNNFDANGYLVKWSDGSYATGIGGAPLDDFGSIYIKNETSKATGFWIASPSAYVELYGPINLMITCSGGYITNTSSSSDGFTGFRPVVCLKSGYDLVKNDGTDTYRIEDKGKPTLTVTGNTDEWSTNKELTITASDAESGIANVTVNGVSQILTDGVATYTVSINGIYTIVATDNNGNTTTEEVVVTKIDNTAPTITFSKQSNSTELATQEVGVTVTEDGSGIAVCKYVWLESETSPENEEDYTDGEISSGETISKKGLAGEYYLHIYARDNAGNVTKTRTTGTFKFRYEIWNQAELEQFRDEVDAGNSFEGKTVYLMDNINLTSSSGEWDSIGDSENDEGTYIYHYFKGTFDGQNNTITSTTKGFIPHYVDSSNEKYSRNNGLFLFNNGTITNLNVEGDCLLTNYNPENGVISNCTYKSDELCPIVLDNKGTINNCIREGNAVASKYSYNGTGMYGGAFGGITNLNTGGIITNCENKLSISMSNSNLEEDFPKCIGGIVGNMTISTKIPKVENCSNTGIININRGTDGDINKNTIKVGGIVGRIQGGIISKCSNKATITCTSYEGIIGGIVGYGVDGWDNQIKELNECYNEGRITSNVSYVDKVGALSYSSAGGIAGYIVWTEFKNCYNTGTIYSDNAAGGIIGISGRSDTKPNTIANCYNIGTATGNSVLNKSGSLIGYVGGSGSSIEDVTNCYYTSGEAVGVYYGTDTSGCIQKSLTDMKTSTFVNLLGSTYWTRDVNINNGLPILKWQVQ